MGAVIAPAVDHPMAEMGQSLPKWADSAMFAFAPIATKLRTSHDVVVPVTDIGVFGDVAQQRAPDQAGALSVGPTT